MTAGCAIASITSDGFSVSGVFASTRYTSVVDDPLQRVEDAFRRVVDVEDDATRCVDDLYVYRRTAERRSLNLLPCFRLHGRDVLGTLTTPL